MPVLSTDLSVSHTQLPQLLEIIFLGWGEEVKISFVRRKLTHLRVQSELNTCTLLSYEFQKSTLKGGLQEENLHKIIVSVMGIISEFQILEYCRILMPRIFLMLKDTMFTLNVCWKFTQVKSTVMHQDPFSTFWEKPHSPSWDWILNEWMLDSLESILSWSVWLVRE